MDTITDGEIEKLEKVVVQMEKSVQGNGSPDVMKYEELNNLFHEMTANIAGHARLKKIQQSLNPTRSRESPTGPLGTGSISKFPASTTEKSWMRSKQRTRGKREQLTREHILRGLEVQERLKQKSPFIPLYKRGKLSSILKGRRRGFQFFSNGGLIMLLPEVKKHYGKLNFLIDGEWVDSKSTSIEKDTNPATDEVIAEFPTATKEEAIRAVEAAHRAFQTWRNVSIRDRAYMMFSMHHKFRENFESFAGS